MRRDIADEDVRTQYNLLVATFNVVFTNDIAHGLLIDLVANLKRTPLYRHAFKREVRMLEADMERYYKLMSSILRDKTEFMGDACDGMNDEVRDDILIFECCVCREFDKARIPNSSLYAKMETARAFTELACLQLDLRIKEFRKQSSLIHNIDYLRVTDLHKRMERLCDMAFPKAKVNLNASPECNNAMQVLQRKLNNCKRIHDCICKADPNFKTPTEINIA